MRLHDCEDCQGGTNGRYQLTVLPLLVHSLSIVEDCQEPRGLPVTTLPEIVAYTTPTNIPLVTTCT